MTNSKYVMALDLGTTGNRALIFDQAGKIVAQAYKELPQHYPQHPCPWFPPPESVAPFVP